MWPEPGDDILTIVACTSDTGQILARPAEFRQHWPGSGQLPDLCNNYQNLAQWPKSNQCHWILVSVTEICHSGRIPINIARMA